MRLLNVDSFTFTTFPPSQRPSYAIASHRWIAGTEASLEDVQKGTSRDKAGYRKIEQFADYIKAQMPPVKWLWIDTCCIDQKSSQEVGEAINSMFRWYCEAEVCLAYMEDVEPAKDVPDFESSVWFRRGWTLQELLAPGVVIFLSRDWHVMGHKGHSGCGRSGMPIQTGPSLEKRLAAITKIPAVILRNYDNGRDVGFDEKLSWMVNRETTRDEDLSYCLLGILDVSMNIRYGDGKYKTRARLMEKVRKREGRPPRTMSGKYHIAFNLKGIPVTDDFVPREADMQCLTSFFEIASLSTPTSAPQRQRVFIVYGMGGIGKTQLCVEFARAHQDHFSAIFWLDGSAKDALHQSMIDAALRLPINQADQASNNLKTRVDTSHLIESLVQWLSLSDNKNWLLIIDNVDREWEPDTADTQAYDYRDFLPTADHGNIIITTRLQQLRRPNASLGLGNVDDILARKLIESRAGKEIQDIEALLPRLSGLPLALVQAGAYLGVTDMTVAEYIRHYDNTWTELMHYQGRFALQKNTERSVLTTWKISYERVKSIDRQAATLLDLWAFLYHGDVWPELVLEAQDDSAQDVVARDDLGGGETGRDEVFPHMTRISLWHSIGVLTQYSMIATSAESTSHSIHPVLHVWCLHNIGAPSEKHRLFIAALRSVASMANAIGGTSTREMGLRLAAQAKAIGKKVETLAEEEAVETECATIALFLTKWEISDEVEKLLYTSATRDRESIRGGAYIDARYS